VLVEIGARNIRQLRAVTGETDIHLDAGLRMRVNGFKAGVFCHGKHASVKEILPLRDMVGSFLNRNHLDFPLGGSSLLNNHRRHVEDGARTARKKTQTKKSTQVFQYLRGAQRD